MAGRRDGFQPLGCHGRPAAPLDRSPTRSGRIAPTTSGRDRDRRQAQCIARRDHPKRHPRQCRRRAPASPGPFDVRNALRSASGEHGWAVGAVSEHPQLARSLPTCVPEPGNRRTGRAGHRTSAGAGSVRSSAGAGSARSSAGARSLAGPHPRASAKGRPVPVKPWPEGTRPGSAPRSTMRLPASTKTT